MYVLWIAEVMIDVCGLDFMKNTQRTQ